MDNYNEYVNDYMNSYNCPDCNDANLQSDKNARKINEVIDQVNALIQINNETVDFIKYKVNEVAEIKVNEVVGEIAEIKVNELMGDLTTEIDDINSSLGNLESEVDELKDGNIDIDLTDYATKDYVDDAIINAKLDGGDVQVDLSTYAKKTDLHDHSNKTILDSITTSKVNQWDSKSNFDGNYNNLTNKPTIPTKVSQLQNDKGYLTSHQDILKSDIEAKLVGTITSHSHNTVNGFSFWFGTQSEYDAIATKSNTTIYMIKEG